MVNKEPMDKVYSTFQGHFCRKPTPNCCYYRTYEGVEGSRRAKSMLAASLSSF